MQKNRTLRLLRLKKFVIIYGYDSAFTLNFTLLDFDKLKPKNDNYIEPKEEELYLQQKLSSQTRQDDILELESKIENDEKVKEIKNKHRKDCIRTTVEIKSHG